jgi:uncharacterized protein YjdB
MLVGLPNGVCKDLNMYSSRYIYALACIAAVACSNHDTTSPGLDTANLLPVANKAVLTDASSVNIYPTSVAVAVGSTITLTGNIKSATGADLTAALGTQATLTSSDTTIATVSSLGVVTGVHAGTATITAALGTLTSKSTITVVSGSASVPNVLTVTPAAATVAVGSTLALGGSVKSAAGVDLTLTLAPQITLTSGDTTIATVSPLGVVTGIRAGTATITVKIGTLSSVSKITVSASTVSPAVTSTTSTTQALVSTPAAQSGGSAVSSMSLLSDDYSEYANTAAFQARVSSNIGGTASPGTALYTDGANANLAAIDNTVLYNGHQTLKYNQPGGVANSPELWVGFSQTLTHLWFRAKIRFSSGFTTAGTLTNSANAYKLLGWGWNNYYGSGRLEISNTNQYQLYWTALAESNSATVGGGTTGIAGNITTEWSDGGWYDYIIEVDYSQGPTGTARVWMAKDGQTPVLQTTSSGTMQGGAPLPTLNQIMLGMNFNQTRAAGQTQALWYGQWEVIDGSQHANPYNL